MTLNDLEPTKEGFLVNFSNFSQFLAAAHISRVNCDQMPEDKPRQPAHEFSALNADFSSLSADPLVSRRPAHVSVKEGYTSKNGCFTDIALSGIKTVADRHRHPAYMITSTSDELLRNVNIDDLE